VRKREGFISNSSSSSFIIAVKNPKKLKVTIEVDLKPYVSRDPIDTEEKLFKYYTEDLYIEEDELKDNDSYNRCLEAIKQGKIVLNISCSSDGDPFEQAIYNTGLGDMVKNNNIELISQEGE